MLERIMPKNIGYYDLFERHANTVLEAVNLINKIMHDLGNPEIRSEMHRIEELEHTCDSIVHMTVELLRHTFIAPLDRDEIRTLMSSLDDVADYVEAAAHRVVLYEITEVPPEICTLCDVLVKTQLEVVELVKMLRNPKGKDYEKHCREINRLENEGDRLHRSGIAALFKNKTDPLTLIKLKEVYEMLESAVDSCEDVANVIEGLFIEHFA